MIRSFACAETERPLNDETSRRLPAQIQRVARRKLLQLHQSRRLDDLRAPYGNRLEALKDDCKGQHSIRVNDFGPRLNRIYGDKVAADTECVVTYARGDW